MSWHTFEEANPELAALGRSRLHGRVAYLATVREDGQPRVHPVTPIVGQGRLFLFMEPASPKGRDIERGGQYALHCGVEDNEGGGGEFFVWGTGRFLTDPSSREEATSASDYAPADRYILFELMIERALGRHYGPNGPIHKRYRASK